MSNWSAAIDRANGDADPRILCVCGNISGKEPLQHACCMQDFYQGFEGEPEIRFEAKSGEVVHESVRMWVGYFEDLLDRVKRERGGWTSLAREYHSAEGWYDESPWQVSSVPLAWAQWDGIDLSRSEPVEKAVHSAVLELLSNAIEFDRDVWIYWE